MKRAAFLLLLLGLLPAARLFGEALAAATSGTLLAAAIEPNLGQGPGGSLYLARGDGFTATFGPAGEAAFRLTGEAAGAFLLRFPGGSPAADPIPAEPRNSVSNYFLGRNPAAWRTSVPQWGSLTYRDIYPGIDLVYRARADGDLEYDFVVHPGAYLPDIQVQVAGAAPRMRDDGAIEIHVDGAVVVKRPPRLFQVLGGRQKAVGGSFLLEEDCILRFRTDEHDPSTPLIIDPVIEFSTYLGGTERSVTKAYRIAVDAAGSVYVGGDTNSATFPVVNAYQPQLVPGSHDGFLLKFDPQGQSLIYSTFFGGDGSDLIRDLAVAQDGGVYVVGDTTSTDLPIRNAYLPVLGSPNGSDTFVARFDSSATGLVFSTYWGGDDDEHVTSAQAHPSGDLLFGGTTRSTNFPVLGAFQPARQGTTYDGFLSRISPAGVPTYSTYIGGSQTDELLDVALAPGGELCMAGYTNSPDFPVRNAHQATLASPAIGDAFAACLDPAGRNLLWSTYFGGSDVDAAEGMAIDASGVAWVIGRTQSRDFPTAAALNPTYLGGPTDLFVARFQPAGTLASSTFLGGGAADHSDVLASTRIKIDADGQAVLCATTKSADIPMVEPVQGTLRGVQNALIARLAPDARSVTFATYLGGSLGNHCYGVDVDPARRIYVAGETGSSDFPVVRAFQPQQTAAFSAFVAKLACGPDTTPADQGNVLRGARRAADVDLSWIVPGTGPWRVYRDALKTAIGSTTAGPDLVSPRFTDVDAIGGASALQFYALRGLSPCTRTPGP